MATFNSQMFYLGNFADMDTDETNYAAENAGLINGTYSKPPLIDVTVEDANNDNEIYDDDQSGTNTSEYVSYDTGGGTTNQYIDSTIVYDVAVLLGDGSTINISGTVIQLQNGDVFITDFGNGGTMDNLNVQSLTLSNPYSLYTAFWANSSVDGSKVVCFCPETLIETAKGPRLVSSLSVGDLVQTRDHGLQPIEWIHSRVINSPGKHAPISIPKDAISAGFPERTLRLSPQHRVLASSPVAERMLGAREVFVAAKALLNLPGVCQEGPDTEVTYWHFACEAHEVVLANGAWVETLFPGSEAKKAIEQCGNDESFDDLVGSDRTKNLARPCPPMRQQKQLTKRIAKNAANRSLYEATDFSDDAERKEVQFSFTDQAA